MSARTKVLLVESDAAIAKRLTRELQQDGLEVVAAHDAVSALHSARREQPDVVVLDSKLAGGGGLVALQRIRSNVYTTNIPVVALLTRGGEKEKDLLMVAGAQECMPIPADGSAELAAAVRRNGLVSLDFTEAPAAALAEPGRMEAVRSTGLLDSPREASFDRITALAARLLGVPAALMTLVDEDRQFFKSETGLAQPWAAERQTRLSHSFCQWVVSGREELVIQDAREHPTLRNNLAIKDMGVIAYAGFPIAGKGGNVIGSFCAIDSAPRAWTGEQLSTLADLAQLSETYALQGSANGAGREEQALVAARAILGAANVLNRYRDSIGDEDRRTLLATCREQAQKVLDLAA